MCFILYRSISFTFVFRKTKFHWKYLNRKKLDKFAQKLDRKLLKCASEKYKVHEFYSYFPLQTNKSALLKDKIELK